VTASIRRVLAVQVGITVTCGLLFWFFSGVRGAVSSAAGGAICLIAALPYAFRAGFVRPKSASHAFVTHALGELLKLVVLLALLTVAFVRFGDRLAALPLLVTFIAATLAYWVALLMPE
jgi:F0F1-type ATP synthase assembly protein I